MKHRIGKLLQHGRTRTLGALTWALAALWCPLQAAAQVEPPCGHLNNAFGPFDYRPDHYKGPPGDNTSHAFKLQLVESAHFTPPVQRLTAGHTSKLPGKDLDYTLRAFPNNHRALLTVMNAAKRFKDHNEIQLPRSFECYFDRALRFAPNDIIARLLYANFLVESKRTNEARQHIEYAETLAGDSAFSHFNIGMSYADIGDYDKALKQAHLAARLGYQRDVLKQRLEAAGRWAEPSVDTDPPAAASEQAKPASAP